MSKKKTIKKKTISLFLFFFIFSAFITTTGMALYSVLKKRSNDNLLLIQAPTDITTNNIQIQRQNAVQANIQIPNKNKAFYPLFQTALKFSRPYVPERMIKEIVETCLKYDYCPLIMAIITVESNLDPLARNRWGAVGCGGIKWKFWKNKLKTIGIASYRDMFDPVHCTQATAFVFNYYLKKASGNIKKALIFYYCGENNRRCHRREGLKYAKKVLLTYAEYELALNNVK